MNVRVRKAPFAGATLFLVTTGAEPPPLVLLVLDDAGTLAGPPRQSALAFLRALAAAFPEERGPGLVLAQETARLVAPLGARGAGPALRALATAAPRGKSSLRLALELTRLEVARLPKAAGAPAVVVVSDLAWTPGTLESLGRLEAAGASVTLVEATSAFTPAVPARAPRHRLPLEESASALLEETTTARVAAAVAASLRAAEPEPPAGSLAIELEAPPRAWLSGEPLRASPGLPGRRARVALVRGTARLAFLAEEGARGSLVSGAAARPLDLVRAEALPANDPALEGAPEDLAGPGAASPAPSAAGTGESAP